MITVSPFQEEELIVLLAQECFIHFNGEDVNTKHLLTALQDLIPASEQEKRPIRKWAAIVRAAQSKVGCGDDTLSPTQQQ